MNRILKIKQTDDQKVFFTADSHFNHNRDFVYEVRGFKSSDDHTTTVINKINEVVKPNDILFHLGDFCLNTNESQFNELIDRIKCHNIYLLFGNHDGRTWQVYQKEINKIKQITGFEQYTGSSQPEIYPLRHGNIVFFGNYAEIFVDGHEFILSHYPIHVFNHMKRGAIHLCGHSHGNLDFSDQNNLTSKILDVGWDDFKKPLSTSEVLAIMKKKQIYKPGDHHQ